jgi:hypothetical protein
MDPQLATVAGAVATVSLQEAVGFVRDQVALILQRRRDNVMAVNSDLLDGRLEEVAVDVTVVERERPALERLWAELEPIAEGQATDPQRSRAAFEELRAVLERVLGQHLTFTGENRPRTGTPSQHPPAEPQTVFYVSGPGNVTIGGDYRGTINM